MSKQMEKIKSLIITTLQKEQDEDMENSKQLKNLVIGIFLTILPVFIFIINPGLADKYFHFFSGQLIYTGQDHYFGFSPSFILDLPYFLPLIIWATGLWFSLKTRKKILSRKSFANYFVLVIIMLDSAGLLYSLWFIFSYFI